MNGRRVFDDITRENFDCALFLDENSQYYLCDFYTTDGAVIISKNETALLTDSRYIEAAEKLFAGTEVTPVLWDKRTAADILKDYKIVAISFKETKHAEFLDLEKIGVKLVHADYFL